MFFDIRGQNYREFFIALSIKMAFIQKICRSKITLREGVYKSNIFLAGYSFGLIIKHLNNRL
jgi:hypothetical protein